MLLMNSMETKFNFKSSICTSREQSERLLALGLKKETADMFWWDNEYGYCAIISRPAEKEDGEYDKVIPAWSLHRLIELALCDVEMNIFISKRCFWINKPHLSPTRTDLEGGVFDGMIDYIKWLIKEGYFNKEYLE